MLPEFKGYPSIGQFHWYCNQFQPFVARNIEIDELSNVITKKLSQEDWLVDLSCTEPGEDFNGNPLHREAVQVKLNDCFVAYEMLKRNEQHWLHKTGLSLYLSQLCVYAKDASAVQVPLQEAFDLKPSLLTDQVIDVINIWMNFDKCSSTMHYDANHNILLVLHGCKTVTVVSPSLTHLFHPINAFVESPNHAEVSVRTTQDIVNCLDSKTRQENVFEITIHAGDMIFIPEGWWHQVTSVDATMAINYWFQSPLYGFSQLSHMQPYFLRHIAHSLTSNTITQSISPLFSVSTSTLYDTMTERTFHEFVKQVVEEDDELKVTQCLMTIISCTYESMNQFWLPFAKQHASMWTKFLLKFTPPAAFQLLSAWDVIDQSMGDHCKEFFEELFRPCNDLIPQVRQHLINQRNAWQIKLSSERMEKILGIK